MSVAFVITELRMNRQSLCSRSSAWCGTRSARSPAGEASSPALGTRFSRGGAPLLRGAADPGGGDTYRVKDRSAQAPSVHPPRARLNHWGSGTMRLFAPRTTAGPGALSKQNGTAGSSQSKGDSEHVQGRVRARGFSERSGGRLTFRDVAVRAPSLPAAPGWARPGRAGSAQETLGQERRPGTEDRGLGAAEVQPG